MAKRMSNKERIQRKGLEAQAAAAEKAKKKERAADPTVKKPKLSGTKSRTKAGSLSAPAAGQRLKLVWKVFNASGKEVAVFAYPERAEADAMAEKLSTKSGQPHFVNGVKVPLETT
jgi:hypothetical protein